MRTPKETQTIEKRRLKALHESRLLDTPSEKEFDDLAILATKICGASAAAIGLIDDQRFWMKAAYGRERIELPCDQAICRRLLDRTTPLVVEDLEEHAPYKSYAGFQLTSDDDLIVGSLAVFFKKPHRFSDEELQLLQIVARQVSSQIQRRIGLKHALRSEILESITDAFYALDKEWRFSYVNAEAERLLKRKREDILGKVVWEEFPQTKGSLLENLYRKTVESQDPDQLEFYYSPLSTWFEVKAYPAEEGMTAYFRDVTMRHQLVADLKERMKEQQSLYNVARVLRDELGSVKKVLSAALLQLPPAVRYPDIAEARILYADNDIQTNGYKASIHSLRTHFETDNGVSGSIELVYTDQPHTEDSEAFIAEERDWIESIADLIRIYLNRHNDREALRSSEARFRNLFQHIPNVAVQGYQLDGTVQYWNDASETFYGYTREEALGKNLADLIFPPETRESLLQQMKEALAKGHDIPAGELILMRKDGSRIPVYSSHAVMKNAGQPAELFCIDIDLSDIKKLEQQFLRAQRMEGIGTLAGGIAHDLNNLLAPIMMGVDLLRDKVADGPSKAIIKNIEQSARRGSDLVKQVLSFARGVEGARVAIQVRYLLREMEAIITNTFPKNIQLSLHAPKELRLVVGDPTQLNQILLNLCVNARDAMPDGGRLSITAHNVTIDDEAYTVIDRAAAKGDYVLIEVSDEGIGINPEIMDQIFDPFFTTKELGKGTGLGLSTVLGIVRSHGGFINAYSEVNKGSVFKVYLPAAEEEDGGPDNVQIRDDLPRGKGETILVVDDEASILTITRQTLEAFGYKILTAEDGAQAIALFAQHHTQIAMVLTDMMMPVMDGPALISAIRRIGSDVPIVAASGLNANGNVAKAVKAGVSHFVDKPYSADTLLRTIAEVLQKPQEDS